MKLRQFFRLFFEEEDFWAFIGVKVCWGEHEETVMPRKIHSQKIEWRFFPFKIASFCFLLKSTKAAGGHKNFALGGAKMGQISISMPISNQA